MRLLPNFVCSKVVCFFLLQSRGKQGHVPEAWQTRKNIIVRTNDSGWMTKQQFYDFYVMVSPLSHYYSPCGKSCARDPMFDPVVCSWSVPCFAVGTAVVHTVLWYQTIRSLQCVLPWMLGKPASFENEEEFEEISDVVSNIGDPESPEWDDLVPVYDGPKVFIMDNALVHCNMDVLFSCEKFNIHFIYLPKYTTPILQPLDKVP